MPRAKRTNRAEARRRYRASIGESTPEDAFDEEEPQGLDRSSAPKAGEPHAGAPRASAMPFDRRSARLTCVRTCARCRA